MSQKLASSTPNHSSTPHLSSIYLDNIVGPFSIPSSIYFFSLFVFLFISSNVQTLIIIMGNVSFLQSEFQLFCEDQK